MNRCHSFTAHHSSQLRKRHALGLFWIAGLLAGGFFFLFGAERLVPLMLVFLRGKRVDRFVFLPDFPTAFFVNFRRFHANARPVVYYRLWESVSLLFCIRRPAHFLWLRRLACSLSSLLQRVFFFSISLLVMALLFARRKRPFLFGSILFCVGITSDWKH